MVSWVAVTAVAESLLKNLSFLTETGYKDYFALRTNSNQIYWSRERLSDNKRSTIPSSDVIARITFK